MSRPRCSQCQTNLVELKYRKIDGKHCPVGFKEKCKTCARGYSRSSSAIYTKHKKDHCENPQCTATIQVPQQLTVDHKDGDKSNNDPSNLVTLCHNCHALKTFKNRDFLNIAYREYDKMVG